MISGHVMMVVREENAACGLLSAAVGAVSREGRLSSQAGGKIRNHCVLAVGYRARSDGEQDFCRGRHVEGGFAMPMVVVSPDRGEVAARRLRWLCVMVPEFRMVLVYNTGNLAA